MAVVAAAMMVYMVLDLFWVVIVVVAAGEAKGIIVALEVCLHLRNEKTKIEIGNKEYIF